MSSILTAQEKALDLARKATQLQIAVVGPTHPRETDDPPTVDKLCLQIIDKARAIKEMQP